MKITKIPFYLLRTTIPVGISSDNMEKIPMWALKCRDLAVTLMLLRSCFYTAAKQLNFIGTCTETQSQRQNCVNRLWDSLSKLRKKVCLC